MKLIVFFILVLDFYFLNLSLSLQVIRRLQNEMDKAGIKYEAARNITRRYEEIMTHMQEVKRYAEH